VARLDRVGVRTRNSLQCVIDVVAVLLSGATAVLIDATEPEERAGRQLGFLCHHTLEEDEVRHLTPELRERPPAGPASLRPAFIVYTTGSTAASRAVAQSNYSVVVDAVAVARHHAMRPGDVMACPLPISHVNGLEFGLLATLFSGGTCLLFQAFEPLTCLDIMDREAATRATMVPSLLQALLHRRRWPRLASLRSIASAAAPLPAWVAAGVFERCGRQVIQGYGLSECMNFATIMPARLDDRRYRDLVLDASIPPVGHELPCCEVAVQRDGRPCAHGEVGEVCVRGHSVMSGYLGDEEATREALAGGWLRTGDLGRLDPAPTGAPWLTLVGRLKNVVKCAGLSISLEEMERWAAGLPGVAEAICVGRPDVARGEAVTLFYLCHPEASEDPGVVSRHTARLFDQRRTGLVVHRLTLFPRLRSGKVDRQALRLMAAGESTPSARQE
jgi:acyl-CoA synthetase (AMP-forming)/AMP-acid ligase II